MERTSRASGPPHDAPRKHRTAALHAASLEGMAALRALGRELTAWKGTRARAVLNVQAVLSVGLAVLLARALHLEHTWWAAISGFAIMRDSVAGCMERGFHRILGTLAGAASGVLVGPWIGERPWLFVPALGLIAGYTVLRANDSRSSYAWVLGGVTALMVINEAHTLTSESGTLHFACSRMAEVVVGTLACVLVAAAMPRLSGFRVHAREQGAVAARQAPAPMGDATRAIRMRLAVCAGLTTAGMAALNCSVLLPGLVQAMVTSIALLILPVEALAECPTAAIRQRMTQRLIGCLLAGLIGVGLLPLTNGAAVPCMAALSLGVWLGHHVQTGVEGASYVGRQFTVAFIMVFVQDHQWSADPGPALTRFYGILLGAATLAVVMLAVRAVPLPGRPQR